MKKRVISVILALALALSLVPAAFAAGHWDWDTEGHYDTSWYSRTGTAFTLTSAEQLAGLAWIVNEGNNFKLPGESAAKRESFTGKTVRLGADIYLNDRAYTDESGDAHQWPSIGGGAHTEDNAVYNGVFDGQGHTVWNMYIHNLTAWTAYDARNRGLFGITAENAVVENLTIRDGYVRAARSTGGIVGKTGYLNEDSDNPQHGYDSDLAGHGTIIRDCRNVNTTVITTDSKGVGGIVGACWNYALISNCSNSGDISSIGPYPAGGIAGENEYIIENCCNTGEISSAGNNAGGIVGSNKLAISEIRGCYNTGKITGTYAGGLIGFQVGIAKDSYNAGDISGKNAGGLFGELKSGQANENLYYLAGKVEAAGIMSFGEADAKAVTADELRALAPKLGGAFVNDTQSLNNGSPVLPWQSAIEPAYSDVAADAWYREAVWYVMDKGLFDLTDRNAFSPTAPMTRLMLAQALYRLYGAPAIADASQFTDISAASVTWAAANAIVNGTGAGKFSPDTEITREQLATMLHRYHQFSILNSQFSIAADAADVSAFPDAASVSAWAEDAVKWAVGIGLIQGRDGALAPQGTATRAEVATILQRFIEQL
jgi:hypothetical protein